MADMSEQVKEILPGINFETTDYELEFKTSMGDIRLEFYPDIAPNHCKNMIALAKAGFYDDGSFHRIVKGFVIQGGCPEGSGMGGPGYTIDQEFNDRPHEAGVLSMARTPDPNSAGSQFFLCLDRVSYLDGQYTVFGKAKDDESLKVIQTIGQVATGAQDRPIEEVTIKSAEVKESAKS